MFIYTAFISIRVYQLYVWMLNLVLSSLTANYLLGSYQVGNNRKTDCRNVEVWPGPVTFFRGDWSFIFLQPLSPFRWFKKGSRHFLAKECAQVLGNQETCGLIIWPARSDLNGVHRAFKPQNQPNQPMVRKVRKWHWQSFVTCVRSNFTDSNWFLMHWASLIRFKRTSHEDFLAPLMVGTAVKLVFAVFLNLSQHYEERISFPWGSTNIWVQITINR